MGWLADLLKEIPSAARYKAELEELASEHDMLQIENKALKTENSDLHAQLVAAESERQRLTAPTNPQDNRRTDVEERILLLLTGDRGPTSKAIARELSISADRVEMHLADLSELLLVYSQNYMNQDSTWHLGTEGKRYLVRNDLIQ